MYDHLSVPLGQLVFFFNDTATTEIYTLSLHDALPIWPRRRPGLRRSPGQGARPDGLLQRLGRVAGDQRLHRLDRKSTRLKSSHANISYAVFCLKKKILTGHRKQVPRRSSPVASSARPE